MPTKWGINISTFSYAWGMAVALVMSFCVVGGVAYWIWAPPTIIIGSLGLGLLDHWIIKTQHTENEDVTTE